MITVERIKEFFEYDPETGEFIRIKINHPSHKRFLGKPAGRIDSWGHRQIGIDGVKYAAHRLAWFVMTGEWPDFEIDHKDTDPDNNRWDNLRPADRSEQVCNQGVKATNKSGYKGVSWYPRYNKWLARIGKGGKFHCLGYFDKKEDAAEAYANAAQELHGEFARYERPEPSSVPVREVE